SSDREVVGFQLNASSDGMMLDALPADTFETTTAEFLTSKTIGDQGGTLAVDDFSLTIPSGVFTTPVELELYKINNSDSFGPDIRTDTFRVTGIPDEYPETLLPDLKYTGTLTDESYIVVGEEVLISSQSAPAMAYHLFPATPNSGVLTCGPEMAVADIQFLKEDFPPVRSDDAVTTRSLDFFGITGWSTYGSDESLRTNGNQGHFLIRYPTYFVSRADLDPLFQYLEEAYTTYENMGFSYGGRTSWPITVTVMNMASDTYGLFCKSMWGNNSATLQFNQNKLGNLPALRTTAGHEFFHFIQYLYDSRNNFSRNHDTAFSISLHWLNEATAVWAEEKFTNTPDYVSPIRDGHKMAPFDGMEAGSGGNILSSGYHGYGMSALIKYLVAEYGESIVRDMYLKISDQQHPIQAINQNLGITDNLFMIWEPFLREYVTGTVYNVTRAEFTGNASGIFRIQTEADTSKSFTEGYPDLSAKLFMIRLDYPDISPAKAISFAIDQDVCDITLFKFRMADTLIQYLSHSTTKQLIQKDLRSLTDDGYYLLVMVTNSNYFAPYINTKQIKLDILIESIAAAMTLSAAPNTLNADGTSASTITATVTDDTGNPVEGETVTFTTDSGGLSASSADTNASGIASVQYTAPASAPPGGTSTITATTTNEITETVVITVNQGLSWPEWPAPQWCPITGKNHVIDYPNGNPDFVTCWYHHNDGSLSQEMPYYELLPGTGTRSRNGVEKQYFESGQLQIERPWQDDTLNGTEKRYYESGQLQFETPWQNDKKNGLEKEYHISASGYHLIHETPYIDGKKNGLEKLYVYSGQLQSETPWQDGKIDGIKKRYYYL
ncbi:MAG: Ig-like domain-containing protein, partial [Anaerolineales bacterium]|nr:Ig-like domain-containing protein [Anaerolineales bacterium]